MGFRVQLLAINGKSISDIHKTLSVTPTGTREEIAESPIVGTQLKNGSYLVYINDKITPDPKLLSRLSNNATVACCYANETVMNSLTLLWHDGIEKWSVFHDAQVAIDHLQINGSPPKEFNEIRQRLLDEESGCTDTDYVFDVPIELFVSQGGMRYDEDPDSTNESIEPWEILERI